MYICGRSGVIWAYNGVIWARRIKRIYGAIGGSMGS